MTCPVDRRGMKLMLSAVGGEKSNYCLSDLTLQHSKIGNAADAPREMGSNEHGKTTGISFCYAFYRRVLRVQR